MTAQLIPGNPADNTNQDSLNSALGEADDIQDACSQITVPKVFPDDKVIDLKEFIESELVNAGYRVTMYSVARPSASTIEFDYEVEGGSPVEVDKIIESRTNDFVQNGYTGFGSPDSETVTETVTDTVETEVPVDDRSLDSSKQEELNCAVENARVEQTEQGTFVVKGDTERFGKDAILYEHYSEEGANKYLDKLKRDGDLAATGYTRSEVDTDSSKKEELNCSEGINAAKLTTEGIAKAMNNSIREDPDTPIVMIPLEGDNVVFISPAGYEDNALVMQGKFPEAAMYVEIFHRDNSATRKKVSGSEVVDFIQNFMAEDLADN